LCDLNYSVFLKRLNKNNYNVLKCDLSKILKVAVKIIFVRKSYFNLKGFVLF
jgi:hypothetical protein